MEQKTQIPSSIIERHETYKKWQIYWYSLHYMAGVIAIVAGVLTTAADTASVPAFIKNYTWVWGVLAALLSGVVTFLGPLKKAESYKRAYYILAVAITRFEAGDTSMKTLLDEYERAQNLVLQGDLAGPPKPDVRRVATNLN